jgi:hypothetical protein
LDGERVGVRGFISIDFWLPLTRLALLADLSLSGRGD